MYGSNNGNDLFERSINSPSYGNGAAPSSYTSAAVSRSEELLSCAKTAVKIAKRQNTDAPGWWQNVDPTHMTLYDSKNPHQYTEDMS